MGWFQKVIYGVDLDEEQARGDRADAELAALNRRELDEGTWTQDIYDVAERQRLESLTGDVQAQVGDSFEQGWNEGADNIRNTVGSTINTVVGTPLKLIPWQLWLAGAVYLAFRLGLLNKLFQRR
jgi:hypothetical protein